MSAKNKITQNDLRRFMSMHKKKLSETSKKIESPLAKYLPDGTLKCIVCDAVVRNDTVWAVHINAKQHKDNIIRRKQGTLAAQERLGFTQDKPEVERKYDFQEPSSNKRHEAEDQEPPPPPKKLKGILKNGSLPVGFFDQPGPSNITPTVPIPVKMEVSVISEVKIEEPENVEMKTPEHQQTIGFLDSDLPEGFFDNPLLDAKARNVEYKDPVEEEWERFQKEMKEEVTLSAQIIQDESEVATVERQIVEVDEQLKNWSRVLDLEKKKETLQTNMILAQDVKKEEEANSSGDENLEEFVSWRTKKSFR